MENKILRFDIETAPECLTEVERANYLKREQWEKKAEQNADVDWTFKSYLQKAGLYPEFSTVVCVCIILGNNRKTISIRDHTEIELLHEVNDIFTKWNWLLGGFNVYNFDIPYLRKRMVINKIQPALSICVVDIKPRDMDKAIVDVMQIWRQTSFSCSLDLLSLTLLWESPKSNWLAELVHSYVKAENYDALENYCMWDVEYTIKCYQAIANPTAPRTLNDRKEEAKAIAEEEMNKPIEEAPLPFN